MNEYRACTRLKPRQVCVESAVAKEAMGRILLQVLW